MLNKIKHLLDCYDYGALSLFVQEMPQNVRLLVRHLNARSHLHFAEAKALAESISLPFSLYPMKTSGNERYTLLSETYLVMRNLQKTGSYTDFVLRIAPFLSELQYELLKRCVPCSVEEITQHRWQDGRKQVPEPIPEDMKPKIQRTMEDALGRKLDPSRVHDASGAATWLEHFHGLSPELIDVLHACCNLLRHERSGVIYRLYPITADMITQECCTHSGKHFTPNELIGAFGEMLKEAFPEECDAELFDVYDQCNEWIMQSL